MSQRDDWGRAPPDARYPYREPISIERATVPFLLVISIVGFAAWATWFGTTAINKIQTDIQTIGQNLTNYIMRADKRVTDIEQALITRTGERMTKEEFKVWHELWCLRTERVNENWRCGHIDGRDLGASPPIWEGSENWRTTETQKK